MLDSPDNVFPVFWADERHGKVYAWYIYAFVIGNESVVLDFAYDIGILYACYGHFNEAVIYEDRGANMNVVY